MKLSYFVPGFSSLILQICVVGGACVVGFSIDAGFSKDAENRKSSNAHKWC